MFLMIPRQCFKFPHYYVCGRHLWGHAWIATMYTTTERLAKKGNRRDMEWYGDILNAFYKMKDELLSSARGEKNVTRNVSIEPEIVTAVQRALEIPLMTDELLRSLLDKTSTIHQLESMIQLWTKAGKVSVSNAAFSFVKLVGLHMDDLTAEYPEFMYMQESDKKDLHKSKLSKLVWKSIGFDKVCDSFLNNIEESVDSLNRSDTVQLLRAMILLENSKLNVNMLIKKLMVKVIDAGVQVDPGLDGYAPSDIECLTEIAILQNSNLLWDNHVTSIIEEFLMSASSKDSRLLQTGLVCALKLCLNYDKMSENKWKLLKTVESVNATLKLESPSCALQCLDLVKNLQKVQEYRTILSPILPSLLQNIMRVLSERSSELLPLDFTLILTNLDCFDKELKRAFQDRAQELVNNPTYSMKTLVGCLAMAKVEDLPSDRILSLKRGLSQCSNTSVLNLLAYLSNEAKKALFSGKEFEKVLDAMILDSRPAIRDYDSMVGLCALLIEMHLTGSDFPIEKLNKLKTQVSLSSMDARQSGLMELVIFSLGKSSSVNCDNLFKGTTLRDLYNMNKLHFLTKFYVLCGNAMNKENTTVPLKSFLKTLLQDDNAETNISSDEISLNHLFEVLSCEGDILVLLHVLNRLGVYKYSPELENSDLDPETETDNSEIRGGIPVKMQKDQNNLTTAVISFMQKTIGKNPQTVTPFQMLVWAVLTADLTHHPAVDTRGIVAIIAQYVELKFNDEQDLLGKDTSTEELVNLLHLVNYCTYLGGNMKGVMKKIFTEEFLSGLLQKESSSEQVMRESVMEVLYHLNQDACLLYPDIDIPWFQAASRMRASHQKHLELYRNGTPSIYTEMDAGCDNVPDPVSLPYGVTPWMILMLDRNGMPVAFDTSDLDMAEDLGLKRVAVQFCPEKGIHRFQGNQFFDPPPQDVYLEKLGFTVAKVFASSWGSISSSSLFSPLDDRSKKDLCSILNDAEKNPQTLKGCSKPVDVQKSTAGGDISGKEGQREGNFSKVTQTGQSEVNYRNIGKMWRKVLSKL
ncbi:uncharacterized protein LOC128222785 [Mya arenaria]|uniref:uncharacterized protein LOC128222785 n=1 Tax=Mya arenaria TaxID=6604 RepID=UPI0022E10FFE|nr:uncharacterized protein LOC128222785 [Mya arenaria]